MGRAALTRAEKAEADSPGRGLRRAPFDGIDAGVTDDSVTAGVDSVSTLRLFLINSLSLDPLSNPDLGGR